MTRDAKIGKSTNRSAIASACWTLMGYGGLQFLRLGANILLARMLLPQALGLMALVNVLNQGLHMLSDAGIWLCVLRSKRGEDSAFLQTAWTLQIVRGIALWVAAIAIAWPAASVYREPLLAPLLAVTGLTSVLDSLRSVSIFTQNRKLAIGRLVLMEVLSYAASMIVAIVWVSLVPTVWALVAANIIASLIQVALSHCWLPKFPHALRWEADAVKEMSHFGRWIFLGTFCTFLASQADRLVLGWMESVGTLGIYHIAAMFAAMPVFLITSLSSQVLLPYYGKLKEEGREHEASQVHLLACLFAWVLAACVQMLGPTVIHTLYHGPYEEAGDMLNILAYSTWFGMLQSVGGAAILANGQARSNAVVNFAKLIALAVMAPIAAHTGGLKALLVAFVLAEVVRYGLTIYAMKSTGRSAIRQELGLTALLLLTNCAASRMIDFQNPLIRTALQLALIAVIGAMLLLLTHIPIAASMKNWIRIPSRRSTIVLP